MRAYVMMTLMNAANGTHFSTPSLSPKRDSNKPELEAGTSSQQPAHLLFTPSLSPKLHSNKPELEAAAGTSSLQPAHLLTKPSLSPKLDSNKPQLEAATSSQRPAHLLFTPSLSPKLDSDSNKPELEAVTSYQRLADLLFTPSLSLEPTPKLPGPDLAHIFTPTASPPPVPTPESKADPTHGLTHTVTPLSKLASTNSLSSTLSGTSSASKPKPPVSSGSGTKRLGIKRLAPLSRSCSPTDLPKSPKMPKTFQTPEKRMVASSSSSSSSAGGSRKKVLSVKKPVMSPSGAYTSCAPMDMDDNDCGLSGLGDEANDSRAFLPSRGDRDEFWDGDGDGDEPMDGVRRTAIDLLPPASPSKPASERLAARKRIGAMPGSKRLAARKRTSMPVSPTRKGEERLATENAKGKGKGREIIAGNATDRGSSEARPMSRRRSLIPSVERDCLDLSAGWKAKGKEKPVNVKKELEDEEGGDSDIVVVSVVKRE
jgi:hypothetical protein